MKKLLGAVAVSLIFTSCAANSDEIKPLASTTLPATSIEQMPTVTTTLKSSFTAPNEGRLFETVVKLCDLAFNSLKCEEDCFSSETNFKECISEAEEIGITVYQKFSF